MRVDGNDVLATYEVAKRALDSAREGGGPTLIEAYTYRMGAHTTSDDPTRYRVDAEVEVWKHRDPIERVKALLSARVQEEEGGLRRGRGRGRHRSRSQLREDVLAMGAPDPITMFDHAYAAPHPLIEEGRREMVELGVSKGALMATTTMTMAKALNAGLRRAMEDNPKVLIMGEDVGKLGGVFRITDGLQKDFGEDRVIDAPLAESAIVGTAVGLAVRGYRTVVEIQFDGFVYPAFDQIVSQVAKLHKRTDGVYTMGLVIRLPFQGGIGAIEHHSESPEAYFAHTAGLRVVSCSTPHDAYWMIQQSIDHDDPIVFCEPKCRYWEKGEVDLDVARGRALRRGGAPRRHRRDDRRLRRPGQDRAARRRGRGRPRASPSRSSTRASIAPLDVETMAASIEKHRAPGRRPGGARTPRRSARRSWPR